MTRNWILGASASAILHGGAVAVFLTSVAARDGASAPEAAQTVIQLELVSALRSSRGAETAASVPSSGASVSAAPPTPEPAASSEAASSTSPTSASAPAADPASPSSAPDARLVSNYYRRLESHLARYHVYPASLVAERARGTVQVGLIVQRDGKVMDAWIQRSSGVASLDQAALATVRRAEPLPMLPAGLPGAIDLIVPLNYEAGPAAS